VVGQVRSTGSESGRKIASTQAVAGERLLGMAESQSEPGGFRFTGKEVLLLIIGTVLALGSLKADDPWVIVPMLSVAGGAFALLCYLHVGKPLYRILIAALVLGVLLFIGWRDLRNSPVTPIPDSSLIPNGPINQNAKDSPCANVVAGKSVDQKCASATGEKDHEKPKKPGDH
jgi:hypothetical protein